MLNSVQSDGAAFGYLHENDIIYSINGKMVTSIMQFVDAMKKASTPRVHLVIGRMMTSDLNHSPTRDGNIDVTNGVNNAVINDDTQDVTNNGSPRTSTLGSQVNKLQKMNICSKPRNPIDQSSLSINQDTPTQIFQPTQTTQIADTQNIIDQESETELELTYNSVPESSPMPKSSISTAQVRF